MQIRSSLLSRQDAHSKTNIHQSSILISSLSGVSVEALGESEPIGEKAPADVLMEEDETKEGEKDRRKTKANVFDRRVHRLALIDLNEEQRQER